MDSGGWFYEVEPKIVNLPRGYVMLGWKINNGYLFVSAYPTNTLGEWYNYRSDWLIYVSDIEQCTVDWQTGENVQQAIDTTKDLIAEHTELRPKCSFKK